MATIYREFRLNASAEAAWARLRDPAAIAAPMPMLADVEVDGDTRICNTVDRGRLKETILARISHQGAR